MDRRTDRRTEVYIQAVINGATHYGLQSAAQALCELGIPIRTTRRVLTKPAERRGATTEDRNAAHAAP